MKYDINSIFIKLAISKGVNDIRTDSKRGLRNLVDLARYFSKNKIFQYIYDSLRDENSSYYELVRDLVGSVDEDLLKNFLYNLAYNSIYKSTKKCKNKNFAKKISMDKYVSLEKYKNQGIYFYITTINSKSDLNKLYQVLEENKDCNFLVKINTYLDLDFKKLREYRNSIISVNCLQFFNSSQLSEILEELEKNRLLYGVHYYIEENQCFSINKFLYELLARELSIGFLINRENIQSARNSILESRQKKDSNFFLVDLYGDLNYINNLINMKDLN